MQLSLILLFMIGNAFIIDNYTNIFDKALDD